MDIDIIVMDETIMPWVSSKKRDIERQRTPKKRITRKNLGNIFLKNLDALSASKIVKTIGATTDVWNRIIPDMIPEITPREDMI